jgi:hypothetical protein
MHLFGPLLPLYKLNHGHTLKIWDENQVLLGTPLGTAHIGNLRRGPFWEPRGNILGSRREHIGNGPQKTKLRFLSCSIVLGVIGNLVRFCAFICWKKFGLKIFKGLFWISLIFFGGSKNLQNFEKFGFFCLIELKMDWASSHCFG